MRPPKSNTRCTTLYLVGMAFWLALSVNATAHPGGHSHVDSDAPAASRTWTLADSGAHWHGTFVSAKDGIATFQRDDGKAVSIAIEQLIESDRKWIANRLAEIERMNQSTPTVVLAQDRPRPRSEAKAAPESEEPPLIHQHFTPFKDSLGLRWDERFYYVESNGLPDHPMMIGITAWQQQVPLPQSYTGNNAWRIPLHPAPARQPMSAKTNFFRGAIALAVNGVPIFNPIKNDGRTDTLLAGELDKWGGHCGRGDDYHYHIAPVHLEKVVGAGEPIAYALDGYPIYGYQDEQATDFAPLDWLNGHKDAAGNYHYHATKTYPYLNGGFYGEVVERDGQVDPQPRARSPRPALPPLRGAKITGFDRSDDDKTWRVDFELRGEKRSVGYVIDEGRSISFTFNDGSDGTRSETFQIRSQREQRGQQRGPQQPPPRRGAGGRPGGPPLGNRGNGGNDRGPMPREPRGQANQGTSRRPWVEVHASEMDTDGDGILTTAEVKAESEKAFAAYDLDEDGQVSLKDLAEGRPVRSAMGGFIREHREELDRDQNGSLSQDEVRQNALRMFGKADTDRDGRITISKTDPQDALPPDDTRFPPVESRQPLQSRTGVNSNERPPNIVFILIDDMGWRDVGFAGNTFVETPHIDRLASEGIQFTNAYASAPNCAPTRACLMSGQYTPRHSVYTVIDPRHDPGQPHHRIISARSEESLSGETITIAEVLMDRGYATACFGMWNLGRGRNGPTTASGQGFDVYKKPQDLGFDQNAYVAADGRYLTDALFDEGLRFIEQHADEPFFLYLPTHAVHAPFEPKPELVEEYREKARRLGLDGDDPVYAAMIEAVDQNVGRLLAHLERQQLADKTFVVFTSDNGGTPQDVAPLNGSKGALYEGGIRVPCAVWWKGIENPGRICDEPVLSMDFYPTLAELSGANLPAEQPIDGVSLLPILRQSGTLNRKAVYWHFPCYIGRGEPCSAVRAGDWKFIQKFEDQSVELFNLHDDPVESRNLAQANIDRTNQMLRLLTNWQSSLNAPLPSEPNPSFDPNAIRRRRGQRKAKPGNRTNGGRRIREFSSRP
jgi:arylsulfatase A